MKEYNRKLIYFFSMLVAVISLSACVTTKATSYKKEISADIRLQEVNNSYKKALGWIEKAQNSATVSKANESYATAYSYLSDAIFKLKKIGHDNNIDVKEELYYCEQVQSDVRTREGVTRKGMMP